MKTHSKTLLDTPCRAESIRLKDGTHRTRDDQGNLVIRDNPIAVSGVFPFLKSQVDDNAPDDGSLVYVYRSPESLERALDFFRNKPIVHHHKWVGKGGERPHADGTIGSQVYYKNGALYSDLIIYNPVLIDSIEKGLTRQLSPGYSAVITPSQGVHNGRRYTYSIEYTGVNHLGVVTNGRAGSKLSIKDTQDFKMESNNASTHTRYSKRTGSTVAISNKMAKTKNEDQEIKTQTRRPQTKQDWQQIKSRAEYRHRTGSLNDTQYNSIMQSINRKLSSLETTQSRHSKAIHSINRNQEKRAQDEQANKAFLDCLQTIQTKLPTFKSFNERNPQVLYKRAYKVMTGQTLQDGLDSETAFKLWHPPTHKVSSLKTTRQQDSNLTLSQVVDEFLKRNNRF